jgi:hypothetical protein
LPRGGMRSVLDLSISLADPRVSRARHERPLIVRYWPTTSRAAEQFNRTGSDQRAHQHASGEVITMHTPSAWTFWLSLALVIIAVVAVFVRIPYITQYALWVAVIGYAILVIGCRIKTA